MKNKKIFVAAILMMAATISANAQAENTASGRDAAKIIVKNRNNFSWHADAYGYYEGTDKAFGGGATVYRFQAFRYPTNPTGNFGFKSWLVGLDAGYSTNRFNAHLIGGIRWTNVDAPVHFETTLGIGGCQQSIISGFVGTMNGQVYAAAADHETEEVLVKIAAGRNLKSTVTKFTWASNATATLNVPINLGPKAGFKMHLLIKGSYEFLWYNGAYKDMKLKEKMSIIANGQEFEYVQVSGKNLTEMQTNLSKHHWRVSLGVGFWF